MTAKLIQSILVTAMAIVFTCGLATAEEEMKAYEMGESGQVVLFQMTPQEIAAEEAEAARLAAIKQSYTNAPAVKTFELAESGETITFTNPAEEIRAANNVKTGMESVKHKQAESALEEYELAESGIIINFQIKQAGVKMAQKR